jgi:hypothetical protein
MAPTATRAQRIRLRRRPFAATARPPVGTLEVSVVAALVVLALVIRLPGLRHCLLLVGVDVERCEARDTVGHGRHLP